MPQIDVDPKLERRLDTFSFDEPRFAQALAEMGVTDERIETLRVVLSDNKHTLQRALGVVELGAYSPAAHRITLYPYAIGSATAIRERGVPAPWTERADSTIGTRCDLVLAHESKHAADSTQDQFIDAWNEKLATDFDRISSLAACMSFGGTAASLYVLDLVSTLNNNNGLDRLEKSADDFVASPQSAELFDGIVKISFL